MSIDSSVVPVMTVTPPDGRLLYSDPYIGGKTTIDEYGNVQITHGYLRADWGSSYPQYDTISDVKVNYIATSTGTSKVKSGWDGVVDSLQTYPGLVYDGSYPPTYNISGGILYLDQGQDVIDLAPEHKWKEVEGVYINDIENPIEPSDLKNTKSNIRKVKPDINSELKRV